MAMQTQQSSLLAKLGPQVNQALAAAKDEPPDMGFQRLPGGITNGIAQLTKCGFQPIAAGKQNAGQPLYRAEGVVIEPEYVTINGVPLKVRGMTTSEIEGLYASTNQKDGAVTTVSQHAVSVQNRMKLLGGEFPQGTIGELEQVAIALSQAKPFFRFSTQETPEVIDPVTKKVKYAAKVWERWLGSSGLENYAPPDAGDAVQDNNPPVNGHAPAATSRPLAGRPAGPPAEGPSNADGAMDDAQPADDWSASDDLDALVAACNVEDNGAQVRLSQLADDAGVDEGWRRLGTTSWEDIAQAITQAVADAEAANDQPVDQEEPAELGPEVGKVVFYRAQDPKTKKPMVDPKTKKTLRKQQCNVVDKDLGKETCTLAPLSNPKTKYRNVPWQQLTDSE